MWRTGQTFRFWSQTPSSRMLCILELRANSLVRTCKHKNTIHVIHSIHTAHSPSRSHAVKPCWHSAGMSIHPSMSPKEGNVTQHQSFLPPLLAVEEVSCATVAAGCASVPCACAVAGDRQLLLVFHPSPVPCIEQGHPQFLSL